MCSQPSRDGKSAEAGSEEGSRSSEFTTRSGPSGFGQGTPVFRVRWFVATVSESVLFHSFLVGNRKWTLNIGGAEISLTKEMLEIKKYQKTKHG